MRFSRCLVLLLILLIGIGCTRNRLTQARQYELQGRTAEALAIYEKVLARDTARDPATRSEILLRRGECLYRLGRLTDAFSSFQQAIDVNPQNNVARLRVGEMFLAAGSPERAREQAMRVLERIAADEDALALLGAAWVAVDNPELAKKAYTRVLEVNPSRVTVAVALADLYNRENNVAKAREVLQTAISKQPGSAMPLLALARLEEQQANSTGAEDAYRRAVAAEDTPDTNLRLAQFLQRAARIAEAEQVLRRVDAQRRDFPVALGDFQLAAGHVAAALESYRAGFDSASTADLWQSSRKPSVPTQNYAGVAARLLETEIFAVAALHTQDKARVVSDLGERLKDFRAQLDAGTTAVLETELAMASGNLVQARVFADAAIAAAPDSPAAHYVAGLAIWNSGDKDRAVIEWKAALELDEHYIPARLALSEFAIEQQDGLAADEYARSAVRDEPGNFRALVLFARALLLQNQPSSAAIMAQRAALLDPSSPEPALLMGEASLQLDRVPEALLNYERAVVAHPDSEEAMDGLMKIYRRGAISYSALQQLERTANEPPVSAPLLEIAGRLYADRGWYKEAIRSFSEALRNDPKRETAARQLAQLRFSTGDVRDANAVAVRSGGKSEALLRAFELQAAGQLDHAIPGYERALREGDQSGVAANNLAWIYAEQGLQLDKAQQLAEEAARLSPNNPAVLDTLGFVLLKRREYTAAVKTLETAAQLAKMKPHLVERGVAEQIRKHLMDAYFSAGETEAASQIAQKRGPFSGK